ncbi:hypothetical protein LTR74_003516 [Friedmanniomyces endolithicus]|nr:hypothetical protein LTR74_003516 [Friedmanniomyces endolithicus]
MSGKGSSGSSNSAPALAAAPAKAAITKSPRVARTRSFDSTPSIHTYNDMRGNQYDARDYGSSASNSNSYHYSNSDGSYYYNNPNGSTYYNDGAG